MLYIGEHVGAGGPEVDIAVDPIEGINLIAKAKMVRLQLWLLLKRWFVTCTRYVHGKLCVGPRCRCYRYYEIFNRKY